MGWQKLMNALEQNEKGHSNIFSLEIKKKKREEQCLEGGSGVGEGGGPLCGCACTFTHD